MSFVRGRRSGRGCSAYVVHRNRPDGRLPGSASLLAMVLTSHYSALAMWFKVVEPDEIIQVSIELMPNCRSEYGPHLGEERQRPTKHGSIHADASEHLRPL
ncbi:hypothetical protein OH77DRAFT_83317 [Trametes cingulata]|nr:hypothetical protein OH77DRAFT_83317 [Trametes cingulata]